MMSALLRILHDYMTIHGTTDFYEEAFLMGCEWMWLYGVDHDDDESGLVWEVYPDFHLTYGALSGVAMQVFRSAWLRTGNQKWLTRGNIVLAGANTGYLGAGVSTKFWGQTLTDTVVWMNNYPTAAEQEAAVANAGGVTSVSIQTGADLEVHRGDTMSISFSDLGDISDYSKLWFAIKPIAPSLTDSESSVLILLVNGTAESDGLVTIAGGSPEFAINGSIAITDSTDGDITVTMEAIEAAKLAPSAKSRYDIQVLRTNGSVNTLTRGNCTITSDVTRSIS